MADPWSPGLDRATAVEVVSAWMDSELGALPLDEAAVKARRGDASHGWRIAFPCEGATRLIDLILGPGFPISKPEAFWVDAPAFPSVPHVEADGRICVLPSSASIDPFEPVRVFEEVLAGVADVLGKGLRSENVEDFRTEFRSYWNEVATGRAVTSIADPCEPSRTVRGWVGRKAIVIAEDAGTLRHWMRNVHGKGRIAGSAIRRVPLIWLPSLPLPHEYPACEADLSALVEAAGKDAVRLYESAIAVDADESVVLLGALNGQGDVCLGAVELRRRAGFSGLGRRQRVGGFRGNAPRQLLRQSRRDDRAMLSAVTRADPWWVHGRDTQDDLEVLLGATVAVLGCGSLGSPTARLLAQAGVGRLVLIDPELMTSANAGRHALGIDAVGSNKATALGERLSREFPHLRIEHRAQSWQAAFAEEPHLFADCDLLVSTIGEWGEECALNLQGLQKPETGPIVFSWAEPHAVGGHAVLIGDGSGCLGCGLSNFGDALFKVADFDQQTLVREPACGGFFQPYGAADIGVIAALATRLALDALRDSATAGDHRALAVSTADVALAGGTLSKAWITLSNGSDVGANQLSRRWESRADCPHCLAPAP